MRDDQLRLLMKAFGEIVREHQAISSALGIIGGDGSALEPFVTALPGAVDPS